MDERENSGFPWGALDTSTAQPDDPNSTVYRYMYIFSELKPIYDPLLTQALPLRSPAKACCVHLLPPCSPIPHWWLLVLSLYSTVLPRCYPMLPFSHFLLSYSPLVSCKFKRDPLYSWKWMPIRWLHMWLCRLPTYVPLLFPDSAPPSSQFNIRFHSLQPLQEPLHAIHSH